MITDKLIEKIKETGNPTVVGLDPRMSFIPEHIKEECFAKYGKTVQFTPLIRSKIVVKIFGITTLDFAPPLEYF